MRVEPARLPVPLPVHVCGVWFCHCSAATFSLGVAVSIVWWASTESSADSGGSKPSSKPNGYCTCPMLVYPLSNGPRYLLFLLCLLRLQLLLRSCYLCVAGAAIGSWRARWTGFGRSCCRRIGVLWLPSHFARRSACSIRELMVVHRCSEEGLLVAGLSCLLQSTDWLFVGDVQMLDYCGGWQEGVHLPSWCCGLLQNLRLHFAMVEGWCSSSAQRCVVYLLGT
ncbi:hypothetical protein EJ03DRAFT_71403 [Teratosphaeria nubilosa]|uniref:Uncharacterized protein n=1 Tax=Teratosphaeria nubilosa TaxID=161662 RepID=A0A6G1LMT9_9PEZI|nr:hypothetical protein EJ03DRAFT_71403 [Teratosphaeria nubilosa]